MTFPAREASRQKGRPIHLYLWRYDFAPGCIFAYTNAEQQVLAYVNDDLGTVTFSPETITHGNITASGSTDKSNVSVRTPRDLGVAAKFAKWPPSKVITLTIYEGHVGEDQIKIAWTGRVLAWKRDGSEAIYSCETSTTSLKRTGLRRNWQLGCNHVLYDPKTCKADKAAASFNAAVTDVQGARVYVSGDWTANAAKFSAGLAEWTCADGRTEYRTIMKFESNVLHLSGRASDLAAGDTVQIAFGCNLQYDDPLGCPLHNNKPNFGGDPFIPVENPIGVVNSYD